MNVKIKITGGDYAGLGAYDGDLAEAPVTTLCPEGIVSARTTEEAQRIREVIAKTLETHKSVVLTSLRWEITAERDRETRADRDRKEAR